MKCGDDEVRATLRASREPCNWEFWTSLYSPVSYTNSHIHAHVIENMSILERHRSFTCPASNSRPIHRYRRPRYLGTSPDRSSWLWTPILISELKTRGLPRPARKYHHRSLSPGHSLDCRRCQDEMTFDPPYRRSGNRCHFFRLEEKLRTQIPVNRYGDADIPYLEVQSSHLADGSTCETLRPGVRLVRC
jgi:hypothetical protein